MSKVGTAAVWALAILVIGIAPPSALAWYYGNLRPVGKGEAKRFEVREGESLASVAERLAAAGLIRNARAFRLRARRAGSGAKPGLYEVDPARAVDTLIDHFVKGDTLDIKVTFPEGFNLAQCAARAEKTGICSAADYLRTATAALPEVKNLGLAPGQSLEGYLFPDTYLAPPKSPAKGLILKQLRRFQDVWDELGAEAKLAGRTRHEIITMASLVEREARADEERARIAGVIANRLRRDMRLQIDATVLYALGRHQDRLSYADLDVDSPYNTYRVRGLPPGPICCPGKASLAAALQPEDHDYYYYVLTGDRTHTFTRTLDEHNRARARQR